jgi:hypothetical protein
MNQVKLIVWTVLLEELENKNMTLDALLDKLSHLASIDIIHQVIHTNLMLNMITLSKNSEYYITKIGRDRLNIDRALALPLFRR